MSKRYPKWQRNGWGGAVLAVMLATGCQQPTGPGGAQPLLPPNPMSGPTRIPPPPTGSVGGANRYTQPTPINGQVSAGLPVNDLVAAALPTPPPTASTPSLATAVRPSPAGSAVQPVAYASPVSPPGRGADVASSQPVGQPTGLAPMIPAAALATPGYADTSTPLRPRLRGMQPIDLTPTPAPQLQPVERSQWTGAGENAAVAGTSFPSTRPGQRFQASSARAQVARSPAAAGGVAGDSGAGLQWRRPEVAR